MRLVIDIPDKDYEFIRDAHILVGRRNGKTIEYNMINAIKNGTPYEEQPQAHWIFDSEFTTFGNPYGTYRCSRCGCHSSNKYSFCKDCGARTRKEEQNADKT